MSKLLCCLANKYLISGSVSTGASNQIAHHNQESMKLARTFFVLFLAFTVCWTPAVSIVLFDHANRAPHVVDMFFEVLAHSNSSINVFLYGFSNYHFRAGYVKFLHLNRFFSSVKRNDSNDNERNNVRLKH